MALSSLWLAGGGEKRKDGGAPTHLMLSGGERYRAAAAGGREGVALVLAKGRLQFCSLY